MKWIDDNVYWWQFAWLDPKQSRLLPLQPGTFGIFFSLGLTSTIFYAFNLTDLIECAFTWVCWADSFTLRFLIYGRPCTARVQQVQEPAYLIVLFHSTRARKRLRPYKSPIFLSSPGRISQTHKMNSNEKQSKFELSDGLDQLPKHEPSKFSSLLRILNPSSVPKSSSPKDFGKVRTLRRSRMIDVLSSLCDISIAGNNTDLELWLPGKTRGCLGLPTPTAVDTQRVWRVPKLCRTCAREPVSSVWSQRTF